MIDVVSIKFKNRGKCYFFDPNSLQIKAGDTVIVETSKGLEMADCHIGNHPVPDNAVVQPLRPVVRIATADDLRVAELNRKREREAFEICQKKIVEHGLDMKLVDVECSFEGSKTTFFFTSDGRVDFRELVKDLAGIFRNRIELRQIGVRDEAKMVGDIGICGRPYCCNQFLDEFQPVSTKMAKVQSLSLNPTKISGSCGRLMCCLRYEEEAYEDLVKHVPKQGAFVETKDGYGTAVQVNLLRQTVKVKLDEDGDDTLRLYKANELCAVPGGRPKDGEQPAHVLNYVPEETEEPDEFLDEWAIPTMLVSDPVPEAPAPENENTAKTGTERSGSSRRRRGSRGRGEAKQPAQPKAEQHSAKPAQVRQPAKGEQQRPPRARRDAQNQGRATVRPVKLDGKPKAESAAKGAENAAKPAEGSAKPAQKNNRRRKYYHGKPKNKPAAGKSE